MNKEILPLLLAATVGSFLSTGCIYSHHEVATVPATYPAPTGRVIVYEAPPAPRQEVVRSPRDMENNQAWIGGYWSFTDNRWVWIPGHMETKPSTTAVWVSGHWDRNPDGQGWIWTPGHWE